MNKYYNYEALRALVVFFGFLVIVAVCLDYGYYQARSFELQGNLNMAAATGVEALPDAHRAASLAMSIANSQGMELAPWEVQVDSYGHRWMQIDKSEYYQTMYLKYVGVKQLPINVHVFDFKPGI